MKKLYYKILAFSMVFVVCLVVPFSHVSASSATSGNFFINIPSNDLSLKPSSSIDPDFFSYVDNHIYYEARYENTVIPMLRVSSNASLTNPIYLNGYLEIRIDFALTGSVDPYILITPTFEVEMDSIVSNDLRVVSYKSNNYGSHTILYYFSNYCITQSNIKLPFPTLKLSSGVKLRVENNPERPNIDADNISNMFPLDLPLDCRISYFYGAECAFLTAPDLNTGFASIISDSIVRGFNQSSFGDIESLLSSILSQQSDVFPQIINQLSDISQTDSRIYGLLVSYLPSLVSAIDDFHISVDRFNDRLFDLLSNYINQTDTAVSESVDNLSNSAFYIESGLAQVPSVDLGNIYQIVDDIASTGNETGDLYFFLNYGRILTIVLICSSMAVLGYVLYGRRAG